MLCFCVPIVAPNTITSDINSEAKLSALDGQIFVDEDEEVFCLWRAEYSPETRLIRYGMDVFQTQGLLWSRSREEHLEYAYREAELAEWLRDAGFTDIRAFADRRLEPPAADEQRVFFAARRP